MTTATDRSLWLRQFHPAPAARPVQLVCFPHAGGSASFYFPVSAELADVADVVAIQYPGRQDRRTETSPTDLHELADRVHEALRDTVRDRPTLFFGHSMGATLAFEVTRRLEAEGSGPAALVASGRRAPSCVREELVHRLGDEAIVSELVQLAGTDSAVLGDQEILRMVLPAIRSDYQAVETYRCTPDVTVRAPISVLTGDSDPKTSLDEARAWERHTTGTFDLQVHPGGHFFLTGQAAAIVADLRDRLTALA